MESHQSNARTPARERWLVALVAIGVLLRLEAWLFDRALWLDELFMIYDVLGRPLARCLEPLQNGQVASPLFILATQCVVKLFGDSERALRLLPLIAGCATLPLFAGLARRAVGPVAAVVATALVAISPVHVYYSADLKPYAGDMLFAVLLLRAGLDVIEADASNVGRHIRKLALLGVAAVAFSLPAPFVLLGVGATAIVVRARRGDRRSALMLAAAGACWIALAAAQYWIALRPHHTNPDLSRYWRKEQAFPLASPLAAAWWAWLKHASLSVVNRPLGIGNQFSTEAPPTAPALLAIVAGALVLLSGRGRRVLAALLLLPVAGVIAAATLERYPFADRVVLFVVPSLALLLGVAIQALWTRLPRLRVATIALAVFLLAWPAGLTLWRVAIPYEREETRDVLEHVAGAWRPGDVVYQTWWTQCAWKYYAPRCGLGGETPLQAPLREPEEIEAFRGDFARWIAGRSRVWFVTSHFYKPFDERAEILRRFEDEGARVIDRCERPSAAAYLLDASAVTSR